MIRVNVPVRFYFDSKAPIAIEERVTLPGVMRFWFDAKRRLPLAPAPAARPIHPMGRRAIVFAAGAAAWNARRRNKNQRGRHHAHT